MPGRERPAGATDRSIRGRSQDADNLDSLAPDEE
jgi:hypothetical protein